MGTGIGNEFGWLDMQGDKAQSGQPIGLFTEHGKLALAGMHASSALISLSHLKEIASAVVVLIK